MKTAILVLTPSGLALARRYRDARPEGVAIFGPASIFGTSRGGPGPIPETFEVGEPGLFGWEGSLRSIVPEVWARSQAIVSVMALGIVVRLMGSLASDKWRDPAVVVVDDAGRYAISVLGGHGSGANALAKELAEVLGAEAIVTTASDVGGLPAVDQIGRELGWVIEHTDNLTRVAAAVVRREPIAILQDAGDRDWWQRFGPWPEHFEWIDSRDRLREKDPAAVLVISDRTEPIQFPEDRMLIYRPPTLVAGIGCRRGTTRSTIESWVKSVMDAHGLAINSLSAIATVMLKIDEPGLIEYAGSVGLPLVAFPAEQLHEHPGIETPSERVRAKVGLLAVAEPSALRAAGTARLLVPKQKGPGVTLALARRIAHGR